MAGGREIHCVTTSIQRFKMTGGVENEKKKGGEKIKWTGKPQIMRPNSAARNTHKTTDFSVPDEAK